MSGDLKFSERNPEALRQQLAEAQRRIKEYERDIEERNIQIDRLREALLMVDWEDTDWGNYCPWKCDPVRIEVGRDTVRYEHAPNCPRRVALGE